jgi:hypothetical protein
MTIVPSLGHGMVPTIFWSACAEGVLKENDEHLDPDGCLVQQCRHRTDEDAAKAGGRHEADGAKKPSVAQGGQLWQEKLLGKSVFLTKTFLWVPVERERVWWGAHLRHFRKEAIGAKC